MILQLRQIESGLYLKDTIEELKQEYGKNKVLYVSEVIDYPASIFDLSNIPLKDYKIIIEVNGVKYYEDQSFFVDYLSGRVYWLGKEFNIEPGDIIEAHYCTNNESTTSSNEDLIACGSSHTMLTKYGTIYSWGCNEHGQLGTGNFNDTLTPSLVKGIGGVTQVYGGGYHNLALDELGFVYAWGYNNTGQLGLGGSVTQDISSPQRIPTLKNITEIACGSFHCVALDAKGIIYTWGFNGHGQLGNGTTTNGLTPEKVSNIPPMKKIFAGSHSTMSIDYDGNLWTWGDNYYGQLGIGSNIDALSPVMVTKISNIKEVYDGYDSIIALCNDGSIWAWGDNFYGQLGLGLKKSNINIPTKISTLDKVTKISRSNYHVLALTSDNKVYSWGCNSHGQLGDGTFKDKNVPEQINNLSEVVQISTCYNSSAIVLTNGDVYTFGNNDNGQLGVKNIKKYATPILVEGLKNIKKISSSNSHVICCDIDSNLWAWGGNSHGQLGINNTTDSFVPIKIENLNIS